MREGYASDVVTAALGWTCTPQTTRQRFRKLGIYFNPKKQHRGMETTLPNRQSRNYALTDPRMLAELDR